MDIMPTIRDMIVSAEGMGLLALAYVSWWVSGKIPNLFSEKKWNWKRGLEDLSKVLLAGFELIWIIGLANVGAQFFAMLGWDITQQIGEASSYAIMGVMAAGFVYYSSMAVKNTMNFLGLHKFQNNELQGDPKKYEDGSKEIADNTIKFLETITRKTSKEDFEQNINPVKGKVPDVLDYVEVDPGKGGIVDTYPNTPKPYRTAAQDTITDPSTCWNRECVSYCAAKIYQLTGKWPTRTGGMNAKYWVQRLAENGYTKVVDRPQNGGKYIGVSEKGEYGHVLWFEEGTTISEYNYLYRGGFSVRNIDTSAYKWVEIKAPTATSAPAQAENTPTKKDPTIFYTYKQGDTFGQVISDLGLKSKYGLWDPVNGDVAYYTNQLREQGITGNIPVGKTIKLTPRK